MLLNGAKLTAAEAKIRGFVTEVFPHDTLKRNTAALIENCANKSSEVYSANLLLQSFNVTSIFQVLE